MATLPEESDGATRPARESPPSESARALREAPEVHPFHVGPYAGEVLCAREEVDAAGARLAALLERGARGASLTKGPDPVVRTELVLDGASVPVVMKTFRRGWWRDPGFRIHGSKGRRAFELALRLLRHGVGSPLPVAWLDRWEGGHLVESRYVATFEAGRSFREELETLLRDDPLCRRILALLRCVATEVARMHEAGVRHGDLGNQNILVARRDLDHWERPRIIDLDRARLAGTGGLRWRALDLSRIDLPSGLRPFFHCMYFGDEEPPGEFVRWEARFRRGYALRTATRWYRHPIRGWREREARAAEPKPPRMPWLWDDRSEQAIPSLARGDRYRSYPVANAVTIVRALLPMAGRLREAYGAATREAFAHEVSLSGRVGLGGSSGCGDDEQGLASALGPVPVVLRLHRHARDEQNAQVLEEGRRLRAKGHSLYLALLQDDAAVREPDAWERFVAQWLPQFSGLAEMVEAGHATNRMKWGLTDVRDYARLAEAVKRHAPRGMEVTGPAAIDFEYHYIAGMLRGLPPRTFDALSHHLYVDRRGAPENRQGSFATLEKLALAKALAHCCPAIRSPRLIVSEVNWPIAGTGCHSPVAAPYVLPTQSQWALGVDEETYADYMLRYLALALCSGHAERVYWWKLVSHGFGIVDDAGPQLRPRPAYAALRHFLALLGEATFLEKLPSPEGAWALRFRLPDGSHAVMGWAHPSPVRYRLPERCIAALSRDGAELGSPREAVILAGSPAYFIEERLSPPAQASRSGAHWAWPNVVAIVPILLCADSSVVAVLLRAMAFL